MHRWLPAFPGQQLSYLIEESQIRGGCGTVCCRDGALIDHHDVAFILSGKYLGYECALSRTGDSGHHGHNPQRYVCIHILQIMQTGSANRQTSDSLSRLHLDRQRLHHCISRQTAGPEQFRIRAGKDDLPAILPRLGAYVNHIVGD